MKSLGQFHMKTDQLYKKSYQKPMEPIQLISSRI